ncbi:hypothetical protein LTR85_012045 [Meristemomyces frigidus]|nr:hypothetical protein LTR85_012045 [Meristemomyces frigidus]
MASTRVLRPRNLGAQHPVTDVYSPDNAGPSASSKAATHGGDPQPSGDAFWKDTQLASPPTQQIQGQSVQFRGSTSERQANARRRAGKVVQSRSTTLWTPPLPGSSTPDLLMSLPAELRNRIYELAMSGEALCRVGTRAWAEPALLRTSTQVRSEALPVYYGNNLFSLHLDLNRSDAIAGMCKWLEYVIAGCHSINPFGGWKIRVSGTVLLNLLPLSSFFELLRKAGISSSGVSADAQSSGASKEAVELFSQSSLHFIAHEDAKSKENRSPIWRFMDQLFKLAEKASREGMSQEAFGKQYRHVVTQRVAFSNARALVAALARAPLKGE